jgi:hypothetical protein
MQTSISDELTFNFYEWEKRGRGWQLYNFPVQREPAFVPFFFHSITPKISDDDGRATSIRSILNEGWQTIFPKKKYEVILEEVTIDPFPYECEEELIAFVLIFPKEIKVSVDEMCRILFLLSTTTTQLSFEIVADNKALFIQIVCLESEKDVVHRQLRMYFPNLYIKETKGIDVYNVFPEGTLGYAIEMGLKNEFMLPVLTVKHFDIDPLQNLFAILDHLDEGEKAIIQIIFSGVRNPWSESIIRAVTDDDGTSLFIDAPEMVPLAKEKIRDPLCAATIRTIGIADNSKRAHEITSNVAHALTKGTQSPNNAFIQLSHGENYTSDEYTADIILRQSRRDGMILNVRELASFIHPPPATLNSKKLLRDAKKTKRLPDITIGHPNVLGINTHSTDSEEATVSNNLRLKHTHVIGATGTGKSTLLLNLIVNDLELGNGIAVLDPHGDLIENIIPRIPEDRFDDVIVIDPADAEYPVGFNILNAHSEIEKEILASDLVGVFKRLSTSWGDQMNSVLANAILAFLESKKGGTLIDLRRFLIEKSFREEFLKTIYDSNITYYWQKEFPILKSNSIGPILTRLDTFLRPKLIRQMVAQKKSIDFEHVINDGKILLVKLSQGLIGNENSFLLGSFIVSKIHQAAMARQALSKDMRRPFFMYIDEFQHFITPSMASILSGARKYYLGLTLAHQDMQQLTKQDSELASSIIANAGTRICFRLGDIDAKRLAEGFSFFDAKDLQNLETGEAIVRVERPEFDFNLSIIQPPELDHDDIVTMTDQVLQQSRERYGTSKDEIDSLFNQSIADLPNEEKSNKEIVKEFVLPKEIYKEQRDNISHTKIEISEAQSNETISNIVKQKEISEHRYLQTLIKRMAEDRGFKATIEETTLDGKGRIDVSLERNNFRIACEVAMTTSEKWEVHNINKCLTAGYDLVVECSTNQKTLSKIKAEVLKSISETLHSKILICDTDTLFRFLDEHIAKEASTETRVKGYRVKVEYSPASNEEMQKKKESISRVINETLKKKQM